MNKYNGVKIKEIDELLPIIDLDTVKDDFFDLDKTNDSKIKELIMKMI